MRCTLAALALPLLAAAAPQGVTSAIAPSSTAPAGCSPNYSGKFEIEIVNVTTSSKRDLNKRQDVALVVTLANGVLTDAKGRTGYIAANHQFQFDGPPQTGAIYTAGWSVCGNGSLALGGSAIFYECLSAPFYNLYDESIGDQCAPIYIDVLAAPASGAASQTADGQVTASPVASQISDGQVTASPVTQISDGQIQATTGAPVTQISDGQIQATTGAPVTQISDGQIQATTGAPVTQISDGQIQATTGSPVTQISDGQIQAPTRTGAPVSQISDGQIQAPTGRNGTVASPSVLPNTPGVNAAAAVGVRNGVLGLAAAVVAVALL